MVAEGAIRERRPREYAPYVAATSGDDRGEARRATHRTGFSIIDNVPVLFAHGFMATAFIRPAFHGGEVGRR